MQTKIVPKQQKLIGRLMDLVLLPVMYLLQGNFREIPQRTHRWNNQHLRNKSIKNLNLSMLVTVDGNPVAGRRWFGPIPLFHMPIFGGWKEFVVLKPVSHDEVWHVGWVAFDALGVTKISVSGPVRMGIGPRQVRFFWFIKNREAVRVRNYW